MLRRLTGAAFLAVLYTGTAEAQLFPWDKQPDYRPPENALQRAQDEQQARNALQAIPDRKASKDPWKNVRSTTTYTPADRHRPE